METQTQRKTWMPVVKGGCCCTLENCCKVQGYLTLICSIMNIIMRLLEVGALAFTNTPTVCADGDVTCEVGSSRVASVRMDGKTTSPDLPIWLAFVISLLSIVVSLITAIVAWFFLKGIRERQPRLMDHYIRLMWVNIGFYFVIITILGVLTLNLAVFLVMIVIALGLPFYMVVCARSLQRELEEAQYQTMQPSGGVVSGPPGFAPPPGYGFAPSGAAVPGYDKAPPYTPNFPAPPYDSLPLKQDGPAMV